MGSARGSSSRFRKRPCGPRQTGRDRLSTNGKTASAESIELAGARVLTRVAVAVAGIALLLLALAAAPASAVPPKPTMLGISNISYTHVEGEADFASDEFQ